MRILGDLDGDGSYKPHDLSGSNAAGGNVNHLEENSSRASGGEPGKEDEQEAEPREQTGIAAPELANDRSNEFAGGVPPAHPPDHPSTGEQTSPRPNDPIGEQRLDSPDDTYDRAQLFPRRTNGGLWFVLMVLAFAMVGAGAYLLLGLRNNNLTLSQVPELLQAIPTLDGRLDASEAKLRDFAANWDGLTNHLSDLDRKVDSGLRATRDQARELVGQASGRLQAQMDQQSRAVDARLNNVESLQRQDQAQLAQLNEQLQGQVASLRQQLTAAQENTGHDLANMQEQVSDNQGDLHTLTQRLHRDKMTFEIVKNSPTELAPGITLTVLKTDVSYQRFRGYISLTNEGKTLWLNNLNVKEAVDLYSQQYAHPYSLIVTAVSQDGVAGYLLLPAGV